MSTNGNNGKYARELGELKSVQNQIKWTFRSILLMNWILIGIGVVMFGGALYSALWLQRWDITSVLSLTGFGDIFTVFKFSMNRVQRCLGDQVQVHTAAGGQLKQMNVVEKYGSNANGTIEHIKGINEEIRKATLYSMGLIQDFTKIAEPLKEKPWIRVLPIRFGKLYKDGTVVETDGFKVREDEEFILSSTLTNASNKPIELRCIVISVRPPFGTPDGGPFRFDFHVDDMVRLLMPRETFKIESKKKSISKNAKTGDPEKIKDEWYDIKDWYTFIACETEDGCWHDDHNKRWFEVTRAHKD